MSQVIAIARPHEGYLAVDAQSVGVHADGRRTVNHHVSKLFVLNAVHAVLGCVGATSVHHAIFGGIVTSVNVTFDEITDRMREHCDRCFAMVAKAHADSGISARLDMDGNSIALLGFSKRYGRIVAHAWDQLPGEEGEARAFEEHLDAGYLCAPTDDGLTIAPHRTDEEKVINTALANAARIRTDHPDWSGGRGPLYVACVRRDSIIVTKACELEERPPEWQPGQRLPGFAQRAAA